MAEDRLCPIGAGRHPPGTGREPWWGGGVEQWSREGVGLDGGGWAGGRAVVVWVAEPGVQAGGAGGEERNVRRGWEQTEVGRAGGRAVVLGVREASAPGSAGLDVDGW